MATREEIRKEIKRISCRWCEHLAYCEKSCGVPEKDLERLSELGVVIKVDRELSSYIHRKWVHPTTNGNVDFRQDTFLVEEIENFTKEQKLAIKEAGLVAVEPLVEG